MPTYQIQTHVHTLHASFQCTVQLYVPYTNAPNYYALMRAGYVLHSLECLECRVVGKCCSNVLRSLSAHGDLPKAVRTCVCEKNDRAHVRSSRYAISYTQVSARSSIRAGRHTKCKHACMPCTYTYLHSSVQCNSMYHTQTCPTTMHSCEQAMYCTH
jgi:hypothetical protein